VVTLKRLIDYPGARQAVQVVRWRRDLGIGKLTIERVYLITSLDVFDATPAELAAWIRGHWGIENLLHHVRDRYLSRGRLQGPHRDPAPHQVLVLHGIEQQGQGLRPKH
jgi:predicted transposase YbfD/YdcC